MCRSGLILIVDTWILSQQQKYSKPLLKANADTSRLVISTILEDLHASLTGQEANVILQEVVSMKMSIMPRLGKLKEEDRRKLAYVLPEYFSDESPNQDVSSV